MLQNYYLQSIRLLESTMIDQKSQIQEKKEIAYTTHPISNLGKKELGLQGQFTCNINQCDQNLKSYQAFHNHLKKKHKCTNPPNPFIFDNEQLYYELNQKGRPQVEMKNLSPEEKQMNKKRKKERKAFYQFIHTIIHEYYLDINPKRKQANKIVLQKAIIDQALKPEQMMTTLKQTKQIIEAQLSKRIETKAACGFSNYFMKIMELFIQKIKENTFPQSYDPMEPTMQEQQKMNSYVNQNEIQDLINFESRMQIIGSLQQWKQIQFSYSQKFVKRFKFQVILGVWLCRLLKRQVFIGHMYLMMNALYLQSCLKIHRSKNHKTGGQLINSDYFEGLMMKIISLKDESIYNKTTEISRRKILSQRHHYLKLRELY